MIKQTQQQRINTLDALNVMWPSVPPENVVDQLSYWNNSSRSTRPTCMTLACFGGWCAWWSNFQQQGVSANQIGAPTMPDAGIYQPEDVAEALFGDTELFWRRGWHPADKGFEGSDHALVSNRLQWLLNNSEVVK